MPSGWKEFKKTTSNRQTRTCAIVHWKETTKKKMPIMPNLEISSIRMGKLNCLHEECIDCHQGMSLHEEFCVNGQGKEPKSKRQRRV